MIDASYSKLFGLLGSAALFACGGDAAERSVITRDSASIVIVENDRSRPEVEWQVKDEPMIRVGWSEEDVDLARVADAIGLEGGGVAVADGTRVLVFDSTGNLVQGIGQEGQGPGEFRNVQSLIDFGEDSLFVHDAGNQRINLFVEGELEDETPLPGRTMYHRLAGVIEEYFVLVPYAYPLVSDIPKGWVEFPIYGIHTSTELFDTLFMAPGVYREQGIDDRNPFPPSGSVISAVWTRPDNQQSSRGSLGLFRRNSSTDRSLASRS